MTDTIRPTYLALVRAAVEATGAERGWLLRIEGDALRVVAAVAPDGEAVPPPGTDRPAEGIVGFVAASGQPAAVLPRPGDLANHGAGGASGVPRSVLAAPCGATDVVGVIEVVDADAGAFSFDDVEVVSLLADIAGAALAEGDTGFHPPPPARLADGLSRLSSSDPSRYAEVARAVEALL
jgi:GAF domain-containing protein